MPPAQKAGQLHQFFLFQSGCLFYAVGQPFPHQKLHDLCRIPQVHPERQPQIAISGSVLPARSRDRSSIRLIFAPFLMGRVSHVVSIADDMSHNPYFQSFISGNEKQLIRPAFSSCHTLISVSKIRLCLSAVNGTAQIHQSSEKELSSLCKKPPRLPALETGAVHLRYGFLFALFKRSHHHLRGFLIAAWAGAKIAERSIYSTMTLIITE